MRSGLDASCTALDLGRGCFLVPVLLLFLLLLLHGIKVQGGRYMATWKREFKLSWREAGPPNRFDDKAGPDQQVVNKELSL